MIDSNPTHRDRGPTEVLPAPIQALVARGDWDGVAQALRTVLALNPSLDAARAAYVQALLRLGRPTPARIAFEPLRDRAARRPAVAALAILVDAAVATDDGRDEAALAAAADRDPTDGAALWRLAQWRIARGRWAEALESLLELVRRDRAFGDDAGRRGMLAVFELCGDDALVREYRRRLAAGLH